ncbi:MAG: BrxA family protein, partial [Thermoanaerobaculia bacterium]
MTTATRASVVSSFTIVKGSMIDETYAVFRGWDFGRSREENLCRMKETNSIGAASESWLGDVYKVLHRRFDPRGRDRPLVELAQARCPYAVWKPILLWHMTRDEFLLRDFLVHRLFAEFQAGTLRVRAEELLPYLRSLADQGLVDEPWKENTLRRVASGLLRMAVDFDLMVGIQAREFASYHLPEPSFLYLLHALGEDKPNAFDVIHAEDWHLY